MSKSLHFVNTDTIVDADPRLSVLDVALEHKIPINHSCEGMGTCGTCRVFVEEGIGLLDAPNDIEKEMIEARSFDQQERLACQNPACAGLKIRIPDDE